MRKSTTIITNILAALIAVAATACSQEREKKLVSARAKSFAELYFNYRYKDVVDACTPDSYKWLSFAASNVSQDDIDLLNSKDDDATCEIDDMRFDSDTTATATIRVRHFVANDSIDKPARLRESALFTIALKKSGSQWKVWLTSLPQELKPMN